MTSRSHHHPISQLLLNASIAMDISQLETVIQGRTNEGMSMVKKQPKILPVSASPHPPQPIAPQQPLQRSKKVKKKVEKKFKENQNEEEDVHTNKSTPSPKRATSNHLYTAAPVTSMHDFAMFPISTKLNNLKLPGKEAKQRSSTSVNNRELMLFPSNYLPKDEDVVVDMAHYPNRELKNLIRQFLPNYLTSSQPKRKSLIAAILLTVSENGGYFIRFWSSRQSWIEVEKVHAERFAEQALQDAASQRGSFAVGTTTSTTNTKPIIKSPITTTTTASSSSRPLVPKRISTGSLRSSYATTTAKPCCCPAVVTTTEPRRISWSERSTTLSVPAIELPMKRHSWSEIPVMIRKRQRCPTSSTSQAIVTANAHDRSALRLKFKRPKTTTTTPRKVSMEERNPLKILSEIAEMDNFKGEERLEE